MTSTCNASDFGLFVLVVSGVQLNILVHSVLCTATRGFLGIDDFGL